MKHALCAALACLRSLNAMALELDRLWDFDHFEVSEARFRDALKQARGDDALVLRTQIARTYSLRKRFAEANRELDAIEPLLDAAKDDAVQAQHYRRLAEQVTVR